MLAVLPALSEPTRTVVRSGQSIDVAGRSARLTGSMRIGGRYVPRHYVMAGDDLLAAPGGVWDVQPFVVSGTVAAVSPREWLLSDGTLLRLAPFAEVLQNGVAVAPTEVPVGAACVARTSRLLGVAGTLEVVSIKTPPSGPTAVVRTSVNGPLKAWDSLRVTARGPAGAVAEVRVPGLCGWVRAVEGPPGTYEAILRCVPGVDVQETRALVRLRRKDGTEAVSWSQDRLHISTTPPEIESRWPPQDGTVAGDRLSVYAVVASRASYVLTPSVRLLVDGRDVTGQSIRNPSLVFWEAPQPLAAGVHEVRLMVRDAAGNGAAHQWKFTVR